jgi:hypothetical protein
VFELELAPVGKTADVGVGLVEARSNVDEFAPVPQTPPPPPYTASPPVSNESTVASRLLVPVNPPPNSFNPLRVLLKLFASTPPPPPPVTSLGCLAGETDGLFELATLT